MQQKTSFYITTPIYYGNGLPHVGHFYSSVIADSIYRFHKIAGFQSRFTTGIDENSQKAVLKAEEEGLKVQEYLDKMATEHQKTWDYFGMDYTDFIRTTSLRHHTLVQEVLQHCFEKGDIYQGVYEGKYCVGCEAFKKDEDLIPHPDPLLRGEGDKTVLVCPDHLKQPDSLKEKNYFFKLSKYQTWIEEFYETHSDFVLPQFRFNEVISFVHRGLEDFSISRESNNFGIPLPFDTSQVTYVWFDALFNYYTSLKYSPVKSQPKQNLSLTLSFEERGRASDAASSPLAGENGERCGDEQFRNELSQFWPCDVHVVGKDIIRFHAIFWPAMLASYLDLGEEKDGVLHFKKSDMQQLPKHILCGGHFTVDGQKMSKSLGNVIAPIEYSQKYSKELLTLYMLLAFPIGNDGDYDRTDAIKTYNAKLANNLGNLVNRVTVLSLKLSHEPGVLDTGLKNIQLEAEGYQAPGFGNADEQVRLERINLSKNAFLSYAKYFDVKMQEYNLKESLDSAFHFLDLLNKFADEWKPWVLIQEDEQEAREVLYTLAEGLRTIGLCLYAFFPEKMSDMFHKLGLEGYRENLESGKLQELLEKQEIFKITEKGDPLFTRFDLE